MSKVLCTFSGQLGDVLWSLATVNLINQITGGKVDFGTMRESASLLPFLTFQKGIDNAFVVPDWICENSNHGRQPWHPPVACEAGYERVFHLTYKAHPGISAPYMSLMDFIAYQQGFSFRPDNPPVPFLNAPMMYPTDLPEAQELSNIMAEALSGRPYVAVAFNDMYGDLKEMFMQILKESLPEDIRLVRVDKLPWIEAAMMIEKSLCFVGCRSANYVLAHGFGKRVICYEPHPNRNAHGILGVVFGCGYGQETGLSHLVAPEQHARNAATLITSWREEYWNEAAKTQSGRVR